MAWRSCRSPFAARFAWPSARAPIAASARSAPAMVSAISLGPRTSRPPPRGDWENYLRAAALRGGRKWGVGRTAWTPPSSPICRPPPGSLPRRRCWWPSRWLCSAPMAAAPTFEELMEVLPDGEQFVGTRGGGMDHAASLASRAGCASLIEFDPLAVRHVPVPPDWAFLVAHSLTVAEKSGAARQQYNACRAAGTTALAAPGLRILPAGARGAHPRANSKTGRAKPGHGRRARRLPACDQRSPARARGGRAPWNSATRAPSDRCWLESHASLRDRLHVSSRRARPPGGGRHGFGRTGRAPHRRRIRRLRRGLLPRAQICPPCAAD